MMLDLTPEEIDAYIAEGRLDELRALLQPRDPENDEEVEE